MMEQEKLSSYYDDIVSECVRIFENKTTDYGPTWLFFRIESFIDQLWIKAKRIRTLEENGGISFVNEGREDEYIGIINYGVILLMKMENTDLFPDSDEIVENTELYRQTDASEMTEMCRKAFGNVKKLMERKNHDYGAAWTEMHIHSITDQIIVKIFRIKNIISNKGRLIASEGIDAQISDIINYSVFGLLKLRGF